MLPSSRNATRRAWAWLSWQGSRPLYSFGERDINAYFIICWASISCFTLVFILIAWEIVSVGQHGIRRYASDLYDRFCNAGEVARLRLLRYDRILDNARLRRAHAAERARADRLAVELATLRGMNHMCTALANRVGAYNS